MHRYGRANAGLRSVHMGGCCTPGAMRQHMRHRARTGRIAARGQRRLRLRRAGFLGSRCRHSDGLLLRVRRRVRRGRGKPGPQRQLRRRAGGRHNVGYTARACVPERDGIDWCAEAHSTRLAQGQPLAIGRGARQLRRGCGHGGRRGRSALHARWDWLRRRRRARASARDGPARGRARHTNAAGRRQYER